MEKLTRSISMENLPGEAHFWSLTAIDSSCRLNEQFCFLATTLNYHIIIEHSLRSFVDLPFIPAENRIFFHLH